MKQYIMIIALCIVGVTLFAYLGGGFDPGYIVDDIKYGPREYLFVNIDAYYSNKWISRSDVHLTTGWTATEQPTNILLPMWFFPSDFRTVFTYTFKDKDTTINSETETIDLGATMDLNFYVVTKVWKQDERPGDAWAWNGEVVSYKVTIYGKGAIGDENIMYQDEGNLILE